MARILRDPVNLGTPVINARQWSTGLAPNSDGGWNFIVQVYNYPADVPTEWVVVNLISGAYTVDIGPNSKHANSNFQINAALQANGQARAANGRIFFPLSSDTTAINLAYYDPEDERVHQLSAETPSGDKNAAIFSFVFGHDGIGYGGTQATIGANAVVFSLNPETLEIGVIGVVGVAESANPKYAYYLARDAGNDWLYVAVGQDPWEVVAIDVTTGEQTVLATTSGAGAAIQFDHLTNGWRCSITESGTKSFYWMADGELTPWPGSGAPPGGARTVAPYSNPIVDPPDVDYTLGAGFVAYTANNVKHVLSYPVSYKGPIAIESLTALPDGTVLGSCEQYNGFWRYNPKTEKTDWYGPGDLALVSQVVSSVRPSVTWLCGYPNGALYRYDPRIEWDPLNNYNPVLVGDYHETSGMKYAYYLDVATNGRVYCVGRRERDGTGSGLGYFKDGVFTGHSENLSNYLVRGMAIVNNPVRLVFSGETTDDSDAQIIVYSEDLIELARHTVSAGLTNTGRVFSSRVRDCIVGISVEGQCAYLLNLSTGAVTLTELSGAVGPAAVGPDGKLWVIIGTKLVAIDTATLACQERFDVGGMGVSVMTWQGNDLYFSGGSDGATLYKAPSLETQNYIEAGPVPYRYPRPYW